MLGSDGVSDVQPSRVDGVFMPIHTVAIVAMGIHLLDNLDLDKLSVACPEAGRWSFLLTVAPLVLYQGTASPVNPIAVLSARYDPLGLTQHPSGVHLADCGMNQTCNGTFRGNGPPEHCVSWLKGPGSGLSLQSSV